MVFTGLIQGFKWAAGATLKRRGFQRKKDALNAEKELLEEYKKP